MQLAETAQRALRGGKFVTGTVSMPEGEELGHPLPTSPPSLRFPRLYPFVSLAVLPISSL